MSRTLHLFGTDWCAMMVPIQVIRWYRMQCYDGTDSCATVVPIRRYCHESIAEVVREKEETISKLKEEVREFYEKYSVSFPSEADVLLRNTSIYKKLQYIEIHPKENLEQEDWQNLAKSVEQIIPSFVPVLKEVLSEKEYRVCLLIRLRLPISFVGILVGLSVSGVSAIRKRMLEKLFHKRGKPKDFDDFLYGLS